MSWKVPSTAICTMCLHVEEWDSHDAAGCAMSWHVYENHRERWNAVVGERTPRDPRPETIGVRL